MPKNAPTWLPLTLIRIQLTSPQTAGSHSRFRLKLLDSHSWFQTTGFRLTLLFTDIFEMSEGNQTQLKTEPVLRRLERIHASLQPGAVHLGFKDLYANTVRHEAT